MKKIILISLFTIVFTACENEQTAKANMNQQVKTTQAQSENLPAELLEEDCDDKLEKVKEEPVEISLENNGDQGCSIDEL